MYLKCGFYIEYYGLLISQATIDKLRTSRIYTSGVEKPSREMSFRITLRVNTYIYQFYPDLYREIQLESSRFKYTKYIKLYISLSYLSIPPPSFNYNYSLLSQTIQAYYRDTNITTAQNRSPHYNKLSGIEIIGFMVFSASSNRADINSEVKRSLHLQLKVEKAPLVYGRGDADIYTRFLRYRTKESDVVGLLKSILN